MLQSPRSKAFTVLEYFINCIPVACLLIKLKLSTTIYLVNSMMACNLPSVIYVRKEYDLLLDTNNIF